MMHITAIGDSITRNNYTRPYDTWLNIAFIAPPISGATFGQLTPNSGTWDLHDWTHTTAEQGDVKLYNAGVSGQQIQTINGRFDTDALGHYSDIVIIHGGTNNRTDNGGTTQIHYDNLLAMVQRAKAAGVPRILLGTIPPRSDAWAAANLALYASYNDNIAQIASAEGCEIVDFRSVLEDPANPGYYLPELTYDGLHPSLAGVTAMAAEVRSVVLPEYDFDVLLTADPDEPLPTYDFDVLLTADPVAPDDLTPPAQITAPITATATGVRDTAVIVGGERWSAHAEPHWP